MIVEGYSLHLYCRRGTCGDGDDTCAGPASFKARQSSSELIGKGPGDTRKQARREGWTFQADGECLCPWCSAEAKDK